MDVAAVRTTAAEVVTDPRGVDVRALPAGEPPTLAIYYPGRDAFLPWVITLRPARGKDPAFVGVKPGFLQTAGMVADVGALLYDVAAPWLDAQPDQQTIT